MSNPFGRVGRRTFLLTATAATAAFGRPMPAWVRSPPEAAPGTSLVLLFNHRDSAIAIGQRYLSCYPDDGAPGELAADLHRASGGDPVAARTALRARVRQDFERGDTVLLEGWVLARSECHACAAVALAAGAAAVEDASS